MDATSMLVSLLPVVVGGVIGFASSLGGQWFIHGLQARAEKKRRRAAKFEELIGAFYDLDHWLDQERDYRVIGMINDPRIVSPFQRIKAISSLYFPEFAERINEIGLAADAYRLWMTQAAQKRLEADGKKVFKDGHAEVYQEYINLRHQLLKDLEALALHELQ
jgi:hypothetical protein